MLLRALQLAAMSGDVEFICKYSTPGDQNMLMRYAADGGSLNVVKLALEWGANEYDIPMEIASYCGYLPIVKLLIEKEGKSFQKSFRISALQGHYDIVHLMLECLKYNIKKEHWHDSCEIHIKELIQTCTEGKRKL